MKNEHNYYKHIAGNFINLYVLHLKYSVISFYSLNYTIMV